MHAQVKVRMQTEKNLVLYHAQNGHSVARQQSRLMATFAQCL